MMSGSDATRRRWGNAICLLPVGGGLLPLTLAGPFYWRIWSRVPQLELNDRTAPLSEPGFAFVAEDVLGRTLWSVSLLAYVLAVVTMLVASLWVLGTPRTQSRRRHGRLIATPFVLVGLLLIVASLRGWLNEPPDVFSGIVKPFFTELAAVECRAGFCSEVRTQVLVDWLGPINALLAVSLIFFLSAFAYALYNPRPGARMEPAEVTTAQGRVVVLLYVGAAALVLGAIETHFLWRLPSPAFADQSAGAQALSNLATSLTTVAGVVFTLFLIGVYGAASLVLTLRIDDLRTEAIRCEPDLDVEKWRKRHALDTSATQHLGRVTAAIAPFIAGPLVQAVGSLISG